MENTSTKVAALTWHSSLPETPLILLLSRTTYTWDPGVLTIIGMMLDKYAVSHEIQFIQWSAEFLFLSSTACMQYIAPNGVYSVLHATCFLLQRAAHLSQGNCLCSLHCNSVLNTEYCTERMQWDPGVKMSVYSWSHTELSSTLNKDALGVPILVPQQSCYYRVPSGQENHGIQFLLDPGILRLMDMMLGKIAVASLLHSGQTPCKLLILMGQPVDLKHFWLQLLQFHSWYITTSVCLHVQYCCLQTI